VLATVAAIGASGCGATRATSTAIQNSVSPKMTSATATFISREHGKDKDSGLTVQLLRGNGELAAEVRGTGFKFDDHSSSGPFGVVMTGPFHMRDIDDAQVRIRLVPDGQDDWTFDLNLVMRFDDGSSRTFAWRGLRLDNTETERTLALGPARI
jgi:hypothetical protein